MQGQISIFDETPQSLLNKSAVYKACRQYYTVTQCAGLAQQIQIQDRRKYFDMWLNNTKLTASEEESLFEYKEKL